MLARHEPRREGKTARDSLSKSPDLGSGADARAGDGTAVDGGAARRAGRPAGRQWGVIAADDDGLGVGAALGAGGLCVAVAREVVVELAQGRGAVFYGRVVDGDRLALGGRRHQAGRRRVGLLEGEEREGIAAVTMLRGAEESRRGGLLSLRLRLSVRLRLRLALRLRMGARLGARLGVRLRLRLRLRVEFRLSARARGG